MDRFFYIIYDDQSKVLVFRDYIFEGNAHFVQLKPNLQKTLVNDRLLSRSYKQTVIGLISHGNALIPSVLFSKDQTRLYLEKSQHLKTTDRINAEKILELELENVYGFDEPIWKLLNTYFPKATFTHSATSLLKSYFQLASHRTNKQLFVNVQNQIMQIAVFEKERLFLFNSYTFKSANDFTYFIMLVINQLALRPEKVNLNLSGEIMANSQLHNQLLRYVRHVEFVQRPNFLTFPTTMSTVPNHHFFDLFSLKLCA